MPAPKPPRRQRILVISGPPASGKSDAVQSILNHYRENGVEPPPVVRPDRYLIRDGIMHWSLEGYRAAWKYAYREIEQYSAQLKEVILLEAPLTTKAERTALARQLHFCLLAGAQRELLPLKVGDLWSVLEANEAKAPDRQVPEDVVRSLYNQHADRDNLPALSEGWSKMWNGVEAVIESIHESTIKPILEGRKQDQITRSVNGVVLSDEDFKPRV